MESVFIYVLKRAKAYRIGVDDDLLRRHDAVGRISLMSSYLLFDKANKNERCFLGPNCCRS